MSNVEKTTTIATPIDDLTGKNRDELKKYILSEGLKNVEGLTEDQQLKIFRKMSDEEVRQEIRRVKNLIEVVKKQPQEVVELSGEQPLVENNTELVGPIEPQVVEVKIEPEQQASIDSIVEPSTESVIVEAKTDSPHQVEGEPTEQPSLLPAIPMLDEFTNNVLLTGATTQQVSAIPEEKASSTKGVGVIATIISLIKDKGPITKEQILEALIINFPDRKKDSMKNTLQIQVPNRLNREKGLNIKLSEKGYYIEPLLPPPPITQ
jgi:hypothetical protein